MSGAVVTAKTVARHIRESKQRPDANQVALAVPAPEVQPEVTGRTQPATIPLECKLIARQDRYQLHLAGQTPGQLRKALDGVHNSPAPRVDLVFELRNTGKENISISCGPGEGEADALRKRAPMPNLYGPNMSVSFDLQGPGAFRQVYQQLEKKVAETRTPTTVRLAPGQTYQFFITSLAEHGGRGDGPARTVAGQHWTAPGKYSLRVKFVTEVTPGGKVTFTSNPVTITVEAKPGVPEIRVSGFNIPGPVKTDMTDPTTITSAAKMAERFPDEALQANILSKADFARQSLLLFAWDGAPDDWLESRTETDGKNVRFHKTQGKLPGQLRHYQLFVIPRGAVWELAVDP
jgi:hypothetical protein